MKEYSLVELIKGLEDNQFTSKDLVQMYLERILENDQEGPSINAISEINPDIFQIAEILDEERRNNKLRSKLHGIPLVIKDNINTYDRMHTTASSLALSDFYAPEDAFLVKKLREAGMIILGKANLSEFAYFMSMDNMPSGYGSRSGQVKSPYSKKIDPLGSSTGSAVAVACDFVPVSIGTETNGSLTAPAMNNSITTMKPSLGLVSRTGIIPISRLQDTAGPMGRSVEDCAYLLQEIYGYDSEDIYTKSIENKKYDFVKALDRKIEGSRIGFIKFTNLEYDDEELKIEAEAKKIFKNKNLEIVEINIENEKIDNYTTLLHDFKVDLNFYLSQYKPRNIHSLKDLILFNDQDPVHCLKYGQSIFTASEKTDGSLRDKSYWETRKDALEKTGKLINKTKEENLDVLVTVKRVQHPPIYGSPVIAVPAKALVDDKPRSLFFLGDTFKDDHIIAYANYYELQTQHRIKPNLSKIK